MSETQIIPSGSSPVNYGGNGDSWAAVELMGAVKDAQGEVQQSMGIGHQFLVNRTFEAQKEALTGKFDSTVETLRTREHINERLSDMERRMENRFQEQRFQALAAENAALRDKSNADGIITSVLAGVKGLLAK